MFEQAEIHFHVQEFDKALNLYRMAYKIKPLPGFLFNMGQCQRHLGKYKEALFSYKIFLERIPDAPNRKQVEQLIELTKRKLAELTTRQPSEKQPPDTKKTTMKRETEKTKTKTITDRPTEGPSAAQTAMLWTGVGLTVALAATGVVTGQLAHDRGEEFLDPSLSLERKRELRDTGQAMMATSVITFSLAGAAAIGTVVYYFLGYRRARRSTFSMVPAPVLLSGGGGLALRGEL
jgi:tetratricopeptide (TPR) repeat protein